MMLDLSADNVDDDIDYDAMGSAAAEIRRDD
jgi:hypothetical protein